MIGTELYKRLGKEVFDLSLAVQEYRGTEQKRALSDREIAAKLGITPEEAAELRCVAELDMVDLDWYMEADAFKNKNAAGGGGGE